MAGAKQQQHIAHPHDQQPSTLQLNPVFHHMAIFRVYTPIKIMYLNLKEKPSGRSLQPQ
jgi:hypothetical protein